MSNFKINNDLNNSENLNFSRKINSRPYKILDSPGLIDDFYLNLVDQSSKNDIIVGLNSSVYLWCANKTQVLNLVTYEGEKYASSVMWNSKLININISGSHVAVGNSEGSVQIWDIQNRKLIRLLKGHTARVGVLAWNCNNNVISTGK